MLVRLASSVLLATLMAGSCGHPPDPKPPSQCPGGFLGGSTDTQLEVFARGPLGEALPLSDGANVPLLNAPQGGYVAFIGARATNLDSCQVTLTGSVRDLANGQVRLDERTINLEPDSTGWGQSNIDQIASLANVPLCPNEWSGTDIYAAPYGLTVSVQDAQGHTASKTIQVHFTCPENSDCACLCKAGYVLGQPCGPGGPSGADGG